MAKLSSVNKNNTRKKLVKKYAGKWARLKAIADDESRPVDERFAARLKMAKLPRNSHPTRIRNRCALTGRARGNYRKFGISRLMLRELASQGMIPGVTKSSW
ncbi:MAG TPA: 30S ribosomal protein S14 [Alphaproteobacteria bacterium]|nr:30S ribosomal protein S14 [Alphaproteobacteria bacterium]HCS23114.1 30S ribosomal protein S14 [Rhodospirillaceae bacterium]HRI76559.1 30S ribosomal protein S14 [Alphaproteobacteria bacterium]HRJ65851.1 30S ribosomal protein S14 [Alphaproteobacteria bacterium]